MERSDRLTEPHYPKGQGGHPACPLMAMLRIHLMQNGSATAIQPWKNHSTRPRSCGNLQDCTDRIPDQTTILNFRLLLEKHELAGGILQVIVDQLLHGEGAYVIGDAGLIRKSGFASWLKIARNRPRYLPCRTFG